MARPGTGANLNIAQLELILEHRRSELQKLYRQRNEWEKKIGGIDRLIAKLEGEDGSGRRGAGGRARNDRPLPDYMETALREAGGPLRVGDIAEAVQAAGYRSSSDKFKSIVNQQLIKDDRFIAVNRGVYKLKKEPK
jgi:hypothetical protein